MGVAEGWGSWVVVAVGVALVGGDFGCCGPGGGLVNDALLFDRGGDERLDGEVVHRPWEAA